MISLNLYKICVLVSVLFVLVFEVNKVDTKSIVPSANENKIKRSLDDQTSIETTESVLNENGNINSDQTNISSNQKVTEDKKILDIISNSSTESLEDALKTPNEEDKLENETKQAREINSFALNKTTNEKNSVIENSNKEIIENENDEANENELVVQTPLGYKVEEHLEKSKILRDNILRALEYLLYHQSLESDFKITDALSVLYINILNRKYCAIDLLPILEKVKKKYAKDQMIILLDFLETTLPDNIKGVAKTCLDLIIEGKWDVVLFSSNINLAAGIEHHMVNNVDELNFSKLSCKEFLNMTMKLMNEKQVYESTILLANLMTHIPIKGFESQDVIDAENAIYYYLRNITLASVLDKKFDNVHGYIMHVLNNLYNVTRIEYLKNAVFVLLSYYENNTELITIRNVKQYMVNNANDFSDLLKHFFKDNYTNDIMQVAYYANSYSDMLTSLLPNNYNRYQFKSPKYIIVDSLYKFLQFKNLPHHIESALRQLYIYSKLSILPKYAKNAYLNINEMLLLLQSYNNFNSFDYNKLNFVVQLMKNYFSNKHSNINWNHYKDFRYRNCVNPRKCLVQIAYKLLFSKYQIDIELKEILQNYLTLVDKEGEPITYVTNSRRFGLYSDKVEDFYSKSENKWSNHYEPENIFQGTFNGDLEGYLSLDDVMNSYAQEPSFAGTGLEQTWLENYDQILKQNVFPITRMMPQENPVVPINQDKELETFPMNEHLDVLSGTIDKQIERKFNNAQFQNHYQPVKVDNKVLSTVLKSHVNELSDDIFAHTTDTAQNIDELSDEDILKIICEKYQDLLLEQAVNYVQQQLLIQ